MAPYRENGNKPPGSFSEGPLRASEIEAVEAGKRLAAVGFERATGSAPAGATPRPGVRFSGDNDAVTPGGKSPRDAGEAQPQLNTWSSDAPGALLHPEASSFGATDAMVPPGTSSWSRRVRRLPHFARLTGLPRRSIQSR